MDKGNRWLLLLVFLAVCSLIGGSYYMYLNYQDMKLSVDTKVENDSEISAKPDRLVVKGEVPDLVNDRMFTYQYYQGEKSLVEVRGFVVGINTDTLTLSLAVEKNGEVEYELEVAEEAGIVKINQGIEETGVPIGFSEIEIGDAINYSYIGEPTLRVYVN